MIDIPIDIERKMRRVPVASDPELFDRSWYWRLKKKYKEDTLLIWKFIRDNIEFEKDLIECWKSFRFDQAKRNNVYSRKNPYLD